MEEDIKEIKKELENLSWQINQLVIKYEIEIELKECIINNEHRYSLTGIIPEKKINYWEEV